MIAIGLQAVVPAKKKVPMTRPKKQPAARTRINPTRSAKVPDLVHVDASSSTSGEGLSAATHSIEEPGHEPEAWLKCRDKQLTPQQLLKLAPALLQIQKSQYFQPRYPRPKYYAFAHRVCRAYITEWARNPDKQHMNRENIAVSAVAKVLDQVRPWSDRPHHSNAHMGMLTLLPVIQEVLEIPSYDFKPGSKKWIEKLIKLNRSVAGLR